MSYILEALRKSEQERNQSRVVDSPRGAPMMMGRHPGTSAPWWLWPLLALNLLVLGYLYWHNGYNAGQPGTSGPVTAQESRLETEAAAQVPPPAPETVERVTPPAAEPALSPEQVRIQQPPDATWDDSPLLPPQASPSGSEQAQVPDAAPDSGSGFSGQQRGLNPRNDPVAREDAPLLVDLPAEFRRQVPDLKFNSHVYSSAPGSRRVIINQQYLAEGDSVGPLRLLEITPGGVILSLNNTAFAVPVVRDWIQPRR